MSLQNSELIINQIKRLVESDKQSEIQLNANGGNSLLVVCDPKQEGNFIDKMVEMFDAGNYQIIDLNELMVKYVISHKETLIETFELLQALSIDF